MLKWFGVAKFQNFWNRRHQLNEDTKELEKLKKVFLVSQLSRADTLLWEEEPTIFVPSGTKTAETKRFIIYIFFWCLHILTQIVTILSVIRRKSLWHHILMKNKILKFHLINASLIQNAIETTPYTPYLRLQLTPKFWKKFFCFHKMSCFTSTPLAFTCFASQVCFETVFPLYRSCVQLSTLKHLTNSSFYRMRTRRQSIKSVSEYVRNHGAPFGAVKKLWNSGCVWSLVVEKGGTFQESV